MRIALVHEYLNQFGGAERMLQVLCAMFPRAPIYTLIYDSSATGGVFEGRDIRTSFLQKIPFTRNHHRLFPLLMPVAVEQFDFSEFDIVLSVSASFAKGVITKPKTRHISYCLTPPRFLWDSSQRIVDDFSFPSPIKRLLPPFISYLRTWDQEAAVRVDEFWAISNFIKERIAKYYRKDSTVIYPPVNINKFHISTDIKDYFFMTGRMVPHKKFDIAIRAFNRLGIPLKIAGIGPDYKKLRTLAKGNVEFLGLISDEQLSDYYASARGLVFPQEEDFGIVPLESMASGRPVIAYRSGGAVETVIEGRTGMFFDTQDEEGIIEAVNRFNAGKYDPAECRAQATKFDIKVFRENILRNISNR
jgi:glycosyltransferase involved in cell wall biosynthesis